MAFPARDRLCCSVFPLFLCDPHLSFLSPPLGPAALAFLPCHICHRRSVARVALGFKFNLVSIWCNCFERQPRRRVFSPVFCDPESPGPCRRPSHRCSSAIHKTSGFIPQKGHLNGATSYLHAEGQRGEREGGLDCRTFPFLFFLSAVRTKMEGPRR